MVARRSAGVSSNKWTGTTSSVGTTGGKGRRALKKGMFESSEDITIDYRYLLVCNVIILEKYDGKIILTMSYYSADFSTAGGKYLANYYFAFILI